MPLGTCRPVNGLADRTWAAKAHVAADNIRQPSTQ